MFQDRLGELYDPIECWTSSLRSRSGLPEYMGYRSTAPFTIKGSDLSKAMFKLLLHSSYRYAAPFSRKRFCTDTVYHCEVLLTAGDSNDWFSLSPRRLQAVRRSQHVPSCFVFCFPTHRSKTPVVLMQQLLLSRVVCRFMLCLHQINTVISIGS